jgi:spore germination protein YaaH
MVFMFRKKCSFFLVLCFLLISSSASALQTLFYTLRNAVSDPAQWQALQAHYNQINILITQAYTIDKNGKVEGSVNTKLVDFAHAHNIKFLILVTNRLFDQATAHAFLQNANAQNSALTTLVKACKTGNYSGIQFDFENIALADKKLLTSFYERAALILHHNNLLVSAAIVPRLPEEPGASAYLRRRYENWTGAYDYKAIGNYSDFVTLMAYDQHGDGTLPGPVASIRWNQQILRYALEYIPAQKIFLGIPTYSSFWYLGPISERDNRVVVHTDQISYQQLVAILKRNRAGLAWDPEAKVPYAVFSHNYMYEYIFAENAQSFKAKLDLARSYNLGGIAVWRIGMEDPGIWQMI